MFTKNSRKGFTIVELVIVIAIIAILATALIPTFGGLIGSANRTVDEQLVRQINTYLMLEEAINGKPATVADVQKILTDNGLTPVKANLADNTIYWVGAENRAIIWTEGEGVTYPEEFAEKYADYTEPLAGWDDLSQVAEVIMAAEATQDAVFAAIEEAAEAGGDIIVKLPAKQNIEIDPNALTDLLTNDSGNNKDVTIDLNGGTIDATKSATALTNWTVTVPDGGTLVLANGTLDITSKSDTASALAVASNGYLVLRDMTINVAKGNGVFVAENASEVLIENCTIIAENFAVTTNASSTKNTKIVVRDSHIKGGNVGVLMNTTGALTIENSDIYGWNVAVMVRQGTATIDNCNLYSNFDIDENPWNIFIEDGWSQGNFVPCAALLVGSNNVAGYPNAANCTITNSTVNVLTGSLGIYVEGNQTGGENGATLNYEGIKIYSYADSTYTNGTELTGVASIEYTSTLTAEQRALVYTKKTESFVTINGTILQDGQ